MEEIDLVDQEDNVIGVTDKVTAHREKQIHRVVAVFVFNKKGELYVQVHKSSGGMYDHSVGGHVMKGESYEDAAHREAEEELGINNQLTHLTTFFHDDGTRPHVYALFECVADKGWEFVPNDEVEEIFMKPIHELKEMMKTNSEKFTGGFLVTLKKYCQINGY